MGYLSNFGMLRVYIQNHLYTIFSKGPHGGPMIQLLALSAPKTTSRGHCQ